MSGPKQMLRVPLHGLPKTLSMLRAKDTALEKHVAILEDRIKAAEDRISNCEKRIEKLEEEQGS